MNRILWAFLLCIGLAAEDGIDDLIKEFEKCKRGDAKVCDKLFLTFDMLCNAEQKGLGCLFIGKLYDTGIGVRVDYKKAMEYYQKGCDLGSAESCSDVGHLYFQKGINEDIEKAMKYFQRACDLGSASTCSLVGMLYIDERSGFKVDYKKAMKYFQRACDLGSSCSGLASLYRYHGEDIGVDDKKAIEYAIEYYEKDCDLDNVIQCIELAQLYHYGGEREISVDHIKARKYWGKVCDLGVVDGCGYAAFLYAKSNDYKKVTEYYDKGCYLGSGKCCNDVGNLYNDGKNVRVDYKKAVGYFNKACELDSAWGCYNIGISYIQGDGVKVDYKKAMEYFGKSCDLGHQAGCDEYKKLYLKNP